MITVAFASISTISVESGMSIAMMLAAASWWDGTVITTEPIQAGALAAIGVIQIGCRSVFRAIPCNIAGRRSRAINTAEFPSTHARAAIGLVCVIGYAMAVAIKFGIARWRNRAIVARPPASTVAYASICTIHVERGMPVAMKVAVTSWWNGTIVPTETSRANALAAIGVVQVSRCSMF
jgi:hypothetical protein